MTVYFNNSFSHSKVCIEVLVFAKDFLKSAQTFIAIGSGTVQVLKKNIAL